MPPSVIDKPSPDTPLHLSSPIRTPFAHPAYAEAIRAVTDLAFDRVSNAASEGSLGVFYKRRGPFREAVVPPFTAYSPLLLDALPTEAVVHNQSDGLSRLLNRLSGFSFAVVHLPPHFQDIRSLQWKGWQLKPLYTYHVTLAEKPDLLATWSAAPRRVVKKYTSAYTIREGAEHLEIVADLCHASYQRQQRRNPLPAAALIHLQRLVTNAGMTRTFTATHTASGTIESGFTLLMDDRTAYYWIVGSQPGPAMTVLLGHVLPTLQAEGIEVFDFMGANTPSIAEFKRRFGASLVPYYRAEHYGSALYRVLHTLRHGW